LKFVLFGRERKKEDKGASEDTGKDSKIVSLLIFVLDLVRRYIHSSILSDID